MHTTSSRSAFTLPEVVITALLLTLMMLPISRLTYSTIRSTRYAHDVGDAIAIAQAHLEELEDVNYTSLVAGTKTVDGYTMSWEVEEEDFAKLVRMTISWSILGKPLSATFNTVYTSNASGGISFQ
jgi:Tfp pilus assembly protein PilV